VLKSYANRATVDQIQAVLVPDVIKDDWKKWWEAAKRELKKDGHFQVPLKKTDCIIYQVKEVTLQDRLLIEFRAAKGLKARIVVAGELLKNIADVDGQASRGGGSDRRAERGNRHASAHAACGGAGSHFCAG
jgi:transcription elongation factor GreA-like protein